MKTLLLAVVIILQIVLQQISIGSTTNAANHATVASRLCQEKRIGEN